MKQKIFYCLSRIYHRVKNPFHFLEDFQKGYFRIYARYHRILNSSGKVYNIPLGYKMWLPISWGASVVARRFGKWEPYTRKTLERLVKPGMTVIELGSCYGYFTLLLSKLVGPKGKIYAFEPFPKYFAILEKNIRINGIHNILPFNKAVGEKPGKVTFQREDHHPYASLSQISGMNYSRHINKTLGQEKRNETVEEVEIISLSDFIKQNRIRVDFLFMDVEGCEIVILKDIEEILKEIKPIIFFELHNPFYRHGDMQFLYGLFQNCNYSTQKVSETHLLCFSH